MPKKLRKKSLIAYTTENWLKRRSRPVFRSWFAGRQRPGDIKIRITIEELS
jgi:hypothetical protein